MFAPRWLAKLTIPVMVGAALTTGTGIAMADSTDDTYLSKLHNLGFNWNSGADSDMIAMGHGIEVVPVFVEFEVAVPHLRPA